MNNYKDFLRAHLPPGAFSDDPASALDQLLTASGAALDTVAAEGGELALEAMPDTARELFPAWELSYGIEPYPSITTSARAALLLTRNRARGGLSRQYFIDIAAALGYIITITEFVPFMAGWSRAGDTVYVPEVVNVWNVTTPGTSTWRMFEAGVSRAGDPLGANIAALLETIFNELKPAHTFVFFTYT